MTLYARPLDFWTITQNHTLAVCSMLLISSSLCINTVRKTSQDQFDVPGICFFIGFLLPCYFAMEAGFSIGYTEASPRDVSGSERWSRIEFFYGALQFIPLIIMLLTRMVIRSKRGQVYLNRKDSAMGGPSISDGRTRETWLRELKQSGQAIPTALDQIKSGAGEFCVLLFFLLELFLRYLPFKALP
jgi:hypothetical protein